MAFELKRVLKVLLFASSGPLTVKDIQTAVTRFHEQATNLPLEETPVAGETPVTDAALPESIPADAPPPADTGEVVAVEPLEDDEMYRDVP